MKTFLMSLLLIFLGGCRKPLITVQISGEVQKPGAYQLEEGERILALVQEAGGFTLEADPREIDLQKILVQGQQIVVPRKEKRRTVVQQSSSSSSVRKAPPRVQACVNLNTASVQELQKIPRIGKQKAQLIVEYRKRKAFTELREITKVRGIGQKIFVAIQDRLCI